MDPSACGGTNKCTLTLQGNGVFLVWMGLVVRRDITRRSNRHLEPGSGIPAGSTDSRIPKQSRDNRDSNSGGAIREGSREKPWPPRRSEDLCATLGDYSRIHHRLKRALRNIRNHNAFRSPDDTPWEGGTFKLTLEFTEDYPNKPPNVVFVTKMCYITVYANGQICLDILQNQWSPIYDIAAILTSIQSLLTDPNPNSPANVEAAKLYQSNRREYDRKVMQFVEESWDDDEDEDEDDEEEDSKVKEKLEEKKSVGSAASEEKKTEEKSESKI
eukprot:1395093-Amorphochlora_amoeboformis.AAC.2